MACSYRQNRDAYGRDEPPRTAHVEFLGGRPRPPAIIKQWFSNRPVQTGDLIVGIRWRILNYHLRIYHLHKLFLRRATK